MTRQTVFSGLLVLAFASSAAYAQCGGSKAVADKGTCHSKSAKVKLASDKGTCDKSKSTCDKSKSSCTTELAGLTVPAMGYKVGDKATNCPMEARKLAGDDGSVVYVVDNKDYTCEMSAKKAYAAQLDRYMEEMMSVKFAVGEECVACPMTAKALANAHDKPVMYRVANVDFKSESDAKMALKHAKAAADKVAMKWQVGDKQFCCDKMAGTEARKTGENVKFCVGDKATGCEVTASVELVRAKLEAAATALQEANRS